MNEYFIALNLIQFLAKLQYEQNLKYYSQRAEMQKVK